LAKTLHLWLIGYREGLIEQQHTFPDEIIARDFFYEHDKAAAKYPDIDFEQLVFYARSYIKKHVDLLELYDGAREILELSSKKKLALVSSSPRQLLESGLEIHGLSKYFDFVIAGDDITKHKPDPEAFNQTMEFFSVPSEKTLIIGDAKTDILAGKASGVSTCFFAPESNKLFYNFDTTRASLPDFEIDSLSDFSGIYL
jgi:HAD superfamily hydrolase (TIGR01509 family)